MLEVIGAIFGFMTRSEKRRFVLFVSGRAANGLFDLAGVMLLGYLAASIAAFLSTGNNSGKSIAFAGLNLPALTASQVPVLGLAVVVIFTLKALISVTLTRKLAAHLAKVEARSANTIVTNLLNGTLQKFESFSRDDLQFAVLTGSSSAFNGILNQVATIASEGFLFLSLFASFLSLSPWATLGLFIFLVLVAGTIQVFIGAKLQRASGVLTETNLQVMATLGNIFSSFREIKVLGRGAYFASEIYKARLFGANSQAMQTYLLGMPRYIIETALLGGVFVFGVIQSLSGDITQSMSIVGVFLTGGFRILGAMLPFQAAVSGLRSFIPQAKTALNLLTLGTTQAVPVATNPSTEGGSVSIEARDLVFTYEGTQTEAISQVSFSVPAGTQLALIGPSGAGKSTLADLIIGLLQPTSGSVLLDGQASSEYLARNSGAVSYVPQQTGIVRGTILQNIALGVPSEQVDRAQLDRALEMASLIDFVEGLPAGVDTDLGPQSDTMSGGQLQRLGLARAFYTSPKLIVVDEATSGLDAKTESEITQVLGRLRGKVTVIVIAHRLNTVQHADEVLVIEEGRVAARGNFSQVLKDHPGIAEAARLMSIKRDE